MKPSSTLYFIYCLVAKRWGQSVKIKRDSLHRIYEVNKYGVELYGISPNQMLYHLTHELWNAGYDEEEVNVFAKVHQGIKTYVNFSLQEDHLNISIFAYKERNAK